MQNIQEKAIEELKGLQAHYDYDASYLYEDLYQATPTGFEKFYNFMPLSQHRDEAPIDAYLTAYLISTQAADCGPCLQLVVKMAKEAGLSSQLVQSTLNDGHDLPDHLKLVRRYALVVANAEALDPELFAAMIETYNKTIVAELALAIASARVFPTIKRALGKAQSCALTALEV